MKSRRIGYLLLNVLFCCLILTSCMELDVDVKDKITDQLKHDDWTYVREIENFQDKDKKENYISTDLVYKDIQDKYYSICVYKKSKDEENNIDYYRVELKQDCVLDTKNNEISSYMKSKTYYYSYKLEDVTDKLSDKQKKDIDIK